MTTQWFDRPIRAREIRTWAIVVLALLMAAIAACGDTTAPSPLVGTYTMQGVDGFRAPRSIALGRMEVVSGSLTLGSDRSAVDILTYRFDHLRMSDTMRGTWSVTRDSVIISAESVRRAFARHGDTLTLAIFGSTLEYVR